MRMELIDTEAKGKKDGKKITAEILSDLKHELKYALEGAYNALEKAELEKEEEDTIIEIAATLKGSEKALCDIVKKYSPIGEATEKKIEKQADAFLAGLKKSDEE